MPEMTMLKNEQEAWLFLKKQWEEARDTDCNETLAGISCTLGLCVCIRALLRLEKISTSVSRGMRNKIQKEQDKIQQGFLFPIGREGGSGRIRLCQRFAKECAKNEVH
jgi:hypothetical protein